MLKSLRLENFVLIDECTIEFGPRLNVITGETGHGKTLLAKALHLTLGERADTTLIRTGHSTATIEAVFDLNKTSPAISLLENSGIPFSIDEPLIIRRTIDRTGKNKLFINACASPLLLLQTIAPYLIEIVAQQTSLKLKEKQTQRETIDDYGKINLAPYQTTFETLQDVKTKRELLLSKKEYYERELPRMQKELETIEEIDPQEDEE
ncbi:MAG: AAA family ATPase, partial [Simkaniaceae bacterium]|nr:AAA family ATPase [Simkaniaceae bacterium]